MKEYIVKIYTQETIDLFDAYNDHSVLIRCKDCKHYDSFTQQCQNGLDGIFTPEWFCADGERKEGEGNGL